MELLWLSATPLAMRRESIVMLALGGVATLSVVGALVWRLNQPRSPEQAQPPPTATRGAAGDSGASKPKPETIVPKFDWAPGRLAQATITRTMEQGGQVLQQARISYEVHVDAVEGDRLRIRFENPQPELKPGEKPPPGVELLQPPILVDKKGSFLSIEGEEKHLDSMSTLFEKAGEAPPGTNTHDLMRSIARSRAANSWITLVPRYNGMKLSTTQPLLHHSEEIPLMPGGSPLPVTSEIQLTTHVQCDAGDTAKKCVKIVAKGTPDSDAKRAIAAAISQQPAPPGASVELAELTIESTLVTEPERLLPHHHEVTRTLKMRIRQGSQSQVSAQIERLEQDFKY